MAQDSSPSGGPRTTDLQAMRRPSTPRKAAPQPSTSMPCRSDHKRSTASQPIPLPAATSAPPGSSSTKPWRDASSPAAQCSARYRTSARRMCGAISAKTSAASRRRPVRLICCTKWQRHGALHRGTLHGRTFNNARGRVLRLDRFLSRGPAWACSISLAIVEHRMNIAAAGASLRRGD